jgi:hypothetical protein
MIIHVLLYQYRNINASRVIVPILVSQMLRKAIKRGQDGLGTKNDGHEKPFKEGQIAKLV